MAVEKMKLLSITGKDTDLDDFLIKNLLNMDIQIEDAKRVYKKGWKLQYFNYNYTIKEYIKKCEKIFADFQIEKNENNDVIKDNQPIDEIKKEIDEILTKFEEYNRKIKENEDLIINYKSEFEIVDNLTSLNIKLEQLYNLKYMKFRYGKIPTKNLEEVHSKIDNMDVVYYELKSDEEYTWIFYITTTEYNGKVDSLFNKQDFDRIWIPQEAIGTPSEYVKKLNDNINDCENKINDTKCQIDELKSRCHSELNRLYNELINYENVNVLKKYIVYDQNQTFYIVLWVPENKLKDIENIISKYDNIDYDIDEEGEDINPPTKLKNIGVFRPFETLVKMYGVPNSKEVDPTGLVAITAFIMFGFMFGDVGHGLVIFIIGILLAIKKKALGPVLAAGGVSAMIFGVLYGSIFGKEDIIKPILISPMNNIQTMLIYGIAVGSVFILIAMFYNIINGIKNHSLKKSVFDKNGISGFLLYGMILLEVAVYFIKGKMLISKNALIAIVIFLVICILFGDVISSKLDKRKKSTKVPFVEKIFDIIEMTLSFASNTISFLRLAAFAINHVGLCMAVYLLADMTSGAGNIAIAIIGNIIVIALEGLIVGIQVLRLEYYELFSRFYEGNGREYKSIKQQINEQ